MRELAAAKWLGNNGRGVCVCVGAHTLTLHCVCQPRLTANPITQRIGIDCLWPSSVSVATQLQIGLRSSVHTHLITQLHKNDSIPSFIITEYYNIHHLCFGAGRANTPISLICGFLTPFPNQRMYVKCQEMSLNACQKMALWRILSWMYLCVCEHVCVCVWVYVCVCGCVCVR